MKLSAQASCLSARKLLKHGDSEMRFHVSFRCWLLGHEDFLRCAHDRLYLECIECGRETKGWPIGKSNRSGEAGSGKRTRAMVALRSVRDAGKEGRHFESCVSSLKVQPCTTY